MEAMDICPKCNEVVKSDVTSIYCDICNNWIHFNCSNFSKKQFNELVSSSTPFYCHVYISHSLPIDAVNENNSKDINYQTLPEIEDEYLETKSGYHDINSFNLLNSKIKAEICYFHVNIRSLGKNIDKLSTMLSEVNNPPKIIAVTESKIKKKENITFSPNIMGYNFLHSDSVTNAGGVGVYIYDNTSYRLRTDIPNSLDSFESLWIEVTAHKKQYMLFINTLTITLKPSRKVLVKLYIT